MIEDAPVHPMLDWTMVQIAALLENSKISTRMIGDVEYVTLEEIPLDFIQKATRALRSQPIC